MTGTHNLGRPNDSSKRNPAAASDHSCPYRILCRQAAPPVHARVDWGLFLVYPAPGPAHGTYLLRSYTYSPSHKSFTFDAGISSGIQYNLPGCLNTVQPGATCGQSTAVSSTCCPIGFDCTTPSDGGTSVCTVSSGQPSFSFAPPTCLSHLHPDQQCGMHCGMPPCKDKI